MVEKVECCEAEGRAPDRNDGVTDRAKPPATNNYRDCGIVTRFLDSNTGKTATVAAGEGRGGTIAAGEFLIDPAHLAQVWSPGLGVHRQKNRGSC
jgi:hypothetical protein